MKTPSCSMSRRLSCPMIGLLGVGAAVLSSNAQITLAEGNAVVNINPSSQVGMYNWFVDGQDYLAQQWLWYRVGTTGPESSLDTLNLSSVLQPLADQAVLNYTHPSFGFSVEVTYTLTGGSLGSGASDIAESIKVINNSGGSLDFHLFLYSDFDLNSTALGDTVTSVNYIPISTKGYERAIQVDGGDLNETTVLPWANRAEAAVFNTTLTKLNDSDADNLASSTGSLGPVGPGDMTYAFQWDLSLTNGASRSIVVDKRLEIVPIPEPGSIALTLLGLAALLRAAHRRTL